MLENALHICQAKFGFLYPFTDGGLRWRRRSARCQEMVELSRAGRSVRIPTSVLGRIAAAKRIVEVYGATKDPAI